jgi:hypothetical protein
LRQPHIDAALHTREVQSPFTVIHLDFIGPLPVSDAGHKHVLVIIDSFTRFVELFPATAPDAATVCDSILNLAARYGLPTMLRSDLGTHFTASVIAQLTDVLNLEHETSIPYRPQANGHVERANQEIVRHLRVLILQRKQHSQWHRFLPLAQRICNSMVNRVTGCRPDQLLFGSAIDLQRNLLSAEDVQEPYNDAVHIPDDYISTLINAQRKFAQRATILQKQHYAKYLSKSPDTPTSFAVGSLVLMTYPDRPPTKLHSRFFGPYTVIAVDGNDYTIKHLLSNKELQVHLERLKLYVQDPAIPNKEVSTFDDLTWQVESIVAHRGSPRSKSKMLFKVRWSGFDESNDTWESYSNVKQLEPFQLYKEQHNLSL